MLNKQNKEICWLSRSTIGDEFGMRTPGGQSGVVFFLWREGMGKKKGCRCSSSTLIASQVSFLWATLRVGEDKL